jgi:hypothetical protein
MRRYERLRTGMASLLISLNISVENVRMFQGLRPNLRLIFDQFLVAIERFSEQLLRLFARQ